MPADAYLLDVREPDEWEAGHAPGALHIPLGELNARYMEIDRAPALFETSAPGVFAAGDVRHGSVKRVTTAMGEGATVIQLVNHYLAEHEQPVGQPQPVRPPVLVGAS